MYSHEKLVVKFEYDADARQKVEWSEADWSLRHHVGTPVGDCLRPRLTSMHRKKGCYLPSMVIIPQIHLVIPCAINLSKLSKINCKKLYAPEKNSTYAGVS